MFSGLGKAVLIANKDFRIFLKDRIAMGFTLAFPLMFVLAFTIALGGVGEDEGRLTLTVVTREEAGTSHDIIDDLVSSSDSNTTFRTLEYGRASAMVESGDLNGFLAFPADFSEAIESGAAVHLEMVSDADKPFTQAALSGLAGSISGRLEASRTAARAAALLTGEDGGAPEAASSTSAEPIVTFEVEQVGELRPFKASNFTLPGYLTMFVFFAAMLGRDGHNKGAQQPDAGAAAIQRRKRPHGADGQVPGTGVCCLDPAHGAVDRWAAGLSHRPWTRAYGGDRHLRSARADLGGIRGADGYMWSGPSAPPTRPESWYR